MRFPIPCLIIALAAASLGVAQAAPARKIVLKGAVSFTSKAQGFAVWFPMKPTRSKTVTVPEGKRETAQVFMVASARSEPVVYGVLVAHQAPHVLRQSAKERLENMQMAMFHSYKVELFKSQEIQLSKFKGRDVSVIWGNGTQMMRTRLIVTPKSFYELSARGTKAEMQKQAAQITRFFDSLRILPQK